LDIETFLCGECGSENVQKRGWTEDKFRRIKCKDCGEWTIVGREKKEPAPEVESEQSYTYTDNGRTATVEANLEDVDEIRTADDLIRVLNIDATTWNVDRFQVGKSIAYRKDREVKWDVVDGKVTSGHVNDSGKLLLKPVFNVKVWMSRKTEEIRTNLALEDFKTLAYQFAPKAVSLKYPKLKQGMLYEIEMPDIHIGKLTWGEETGEDSDIKIQEKIAKTVIEELLSHTQHYPIDRILFPIGHDYFNVDNQFNTTAHGTPQQEDTRWRKTFKVGWTLAADMINMCAQIAPVDVYIIPGNHDEERSYYLGEVLSALYMNSKNVCIENSPKARKYYEYGSNLIGMTHGYHEKITKLAQLMSFEVPEMWARTKHREWHTGDKHHKEDYVHKTHESDNGVVVRILRSLTTADAFHYNKGYVGALKASEAFLWNKENGLIAQFTSSSK
jgi:hypothetical protein